MRLVSPLGGFFTLQADGLEWGAACVAAEQQLLPVGGVGVPGVLQEGSHQSLAVRLHGVIQGRVLVVLF